MKKNSDQQFFEELLSDTKEAFEKSAICKKQKEIGKQWNYAVCATPIQKEKGILFGINWGGSENFQPQSVMPTGEGIINYHFIKQSRKSLESLGLDFSILDFNYSNLCSFRTPKERLLELKDYELSIPLFKKYVSHIDPPWMLSIGGKNMKVLDKFGLLSNIERHYDNQNKFRGHSAKLWDWTVYSVPHSSAHLTSESRMVIWNKIINEIKANNP